MQVDERCLLGLVGFVGRLRGNLAFSLLPNPRLSILAVH